MASRGRSGWEVARGRGWVGCGTHRVEMPALPSPRWSPPNCLPAVPLVPHSLFTTQKPEWSSLSQASFLLTLTSGSHPWVKGKVLDSTTQPPHDLPRLTSVTAPCSLHSTPLASGPLLWSRTLHPDVYLANLLPLFHLCPDVTFSMRPTWTVLFQIMVPSLPILLISLFWSAFSFPIVLTTF